MAYNMVPSVQQWNIRERSSGIYGGELMLLCKMSYLHCTSEINGHQNKVTTGPKIIHLIDATSFETEETFCLPTTKNFYGGNRGETTLFFEPSGGSMYASLEGTLYEWNLRKNFGPEWWLGET
jgi:hypothetical protein